MDNGKKLVLEDADDDVDEEEEEDYGGGDTDSRSIHPCFWLNQ